MGQDKDSLIGDGKRKKNKPRESLPALTHADQCPASTGATTTSEAKTPPPPFSSSTPVFMLSVTTHGKEYPFG